MKNRKVNKRLFAIIFAIIFAVGLLPIKFTEVKTKAEEVPVDVEQEVQAPVYLGTPGEDYVDGEVIAIVRGGEDALLSEIGDVSIEENLGSIDDEAVDDDAYESPIIKIVKKMFQTLLPGMDLGVDYEILLLSGDSTEEMIAYLETLDCVISAQPNYYFEAADWEEDEEEDEVQVRAIAEAFGLAQQESADPGQKAAAQAEPQGSQQEQTQADPTKEPFFKYQWGLNNTINTRTETSYDMNMTQAWTNGAGTEGEKVVVAVIDSGVDYNHEDLKNVIWSGGNIPELQALGGGVHGINFTIGEDSTDPMDFDCGHGTHCASVIASDWNGKGTAGITNNAEIMALRILPDEGKTSSSAAIKAFQYVITAKDCGVPVCVTSNSYGPAASVASSEPVFDAVITAAGQKGIISVFAAGNEGYDNDINTNYSLSDSPYTLVVGAMNSAGESAPFSQWGEHTVDLYSPGTQILAATTKYGDISHKIVSMEPHYLPWEPGDAGNVVFVDTYEDEAPQTASISVWKQDGNNETFVFDQSTKKPNTEDYLIYRIGKGYFSTDKLAIDVSSLEPGTQYNIYFTVPSDTVKKIPAEDANAYIAGICGVEGGSASTVFPLQAKTYFQQDGEWYFGWVNSSGNYINNYDGNWRVFSSYYMSKNLVNPELLTKNGELEFRFVFRFDQITQDTRIYFDDVSIGLKDSGYYYSDGTSMACPGVSGVVSTLCSLAAAKTTTTQTEQQVKDIVAFVKGSVQRNPNLSDKCETKGLVDANAAFTSYKGYLNGGTKDYTALKPVPETIEKTSSGYKLTGNFFGTEKGKLTYGGKELTVSNWTDTEISFAAPAEAEGCLELVVTRKDNSEGRKFVSIPGEIKGFTALSTPNFQVQGHDGQKLADKVDADRLCPVDMVSTENALFALALSSDEEIECLLRYDLSNGTWSEVDFPENIKFNDMIMIDFSAAMAAGKNQVYIAVKTDDADRPVKLLTYDDTKKAWTNIVGMSSNLDKQVENSALLVKDGQLFQWGIGSHAQNTIEMYSIFPNKGDFYNRISFNPSEYPNYYKGHLSETTTGITYLGAFVGYDEIKKDTAKNAARRDAVNFDKNTEVVSFSQKAFYNDGNGSKYYDERQLTDSAFGAVDTGFIVTGPVKDEGKASMVDTWIYNAQNDEWQAVTNARFSNTKCQNVAGCTINGKYYVLGIDSETKKMKFEVLDLSTVGLTDTIASNKKNAACGYYVEAETCNYGAVSFGTNDTYVPGSTVTLTATPQSEAYELYEFYAYKKGDENTTVPVAADGTLTMPEFDIVVGGYFRDKDFPVIDGIKNGETYYTTQKFTATDATSGIYRVTVNDEIVTDYTLGGNVDLEYVVKATDNSGNYSKATISMKPVSSLADPIKGLTEENVAPKDKETIEGVKKSLAPVDITYATKEEIDALKAIDENCDKLLAMIEEYENPEIIEGAGTTVYLNNLKDATFRSSAPFDQFERILVDDKELAPENYTKKAGSTIVTLKKEYLKTLPIGTHMLSVVSSYGHADTLFFIKEIPETGDNSNTVLWIILMAAAAAAIAASVGYSIKMRKDNLS